MRDCDGTMHPRALHGIDLFNQGDYFGAHEELEIAWRQEPGRVRQLYQGILEAGVAYLHLRRGNLVGAHKVFARSMRWLREWPEVCRGTDVGQLRRDLEAIFAEASRLGPDRLDEIDRSFFKPIRCREDPD